MELPTEAHLLRALQTYVQTYGTPAATEPLRAIAGAILSVQQGAGQFSLRTDKAETLITGAVTAFEQGAVTAADDRLLPLVGAAHQWREVLEIQIKEGLDAYVQLYASTLSPQQLPSVVLAIIPLLQPQVITRSEASWLAQRAAATFDLKTVMSTTVSQAYGELARQVNVAMNQRPFEAVVIQVLRAYRESRQPQRSVDRRLIHNAITATLKNQVQFAIDTGVELRDRLALVQQVEFQLNVMLVAPSIGAAARQVAQQLPGAVDQWRRSRGAGLDVSRGRLSGDGLSISSPLVRDGQADGTQGNLLEGNLLEGNVEGDLEGGLP